MMSEPTLEPATIVEKVLNDFTDNLDGLAKSELNAIFYITRKESQLKCVSDLFHFICYMLCMIMAAFIVAGTHICYI
jgi:hypothetical protein